MRARRPARTVVLLAVVALAAATIVLTVAARPDPAGASVVESVVAQQIDGTGPAPTGEPLPSMTQRVGDSVVAVLLLVTLAGALVATATVPRWNRARRDPVADDG